MHTKNDIRAADKFSLYEDLGKCWPVTARKKRERVELIHGISEAYT